MKALITEDAEEPPSTTLGIISLSRRESTELIRPGINRFTVNGLDLVIEKCVASQLPEIVSIESDSFPDYIAYSESFLGEEITAGKYYAALDDNSRVIGYFGLDQEDEKIYISNIAVKHGYTRMGIGRMLIDCVLLVCEEIGIRMITLHVSEHNPAALEFYKSYGFIIESYVPEFYSPDDGAFSMVYSI